MIVESKLAIPPLLAFIVIAEQSLLGLPHAVRVILDVAALCVLAAGFLVLGRLKAALTAAEAAAEAWKEERDAAVVKSERLQEDIVRLQVENAKLQERPSFEEIVQRLELLTEHLEYIKAVLSRGEEKK